MTYSQHRANLKQICATFKTEAEQAAEHKETANKRLEKMYSEGDETVLFRSFEEWEKLGYRVIKGSKAFVFWGTPQDFEIRDEKDNSKIKEVGTFFPIVFKFSENQVYRPENLR